MIYTTFSHREKVKEKSSVCVCLITGECWLRRERVNCAVNGARLRGQTRPEKPASAFSLVLWYGTSSLPLCQELNPSSPVQTHCRRLYAFVFLSAAGEVWTMFTSAHWRRRSGQTDIVEREREKKLLDEELIAQVSQNQLKCTQCVWFSGCHLRVFELHAFRCVWKCFLRWTVCFFSKWVE